MVQQERVKPFAVLQAADSAENSDISAHSGPGNSKTEAENWHDLPSFPRMGGSMGSPGYEAPGPFEKHLWLYRRRFEGAGLQTGSRQLAVGQMLCRMR